MLSRGMGEASAYFITNFKGFILTEQFQTSVWNHSRILIRRSWSDDVDRAAGMIAGGT
jgi:hypothetical protein